MYNTIETIQSRWRSRRPEAVIEYVPEGGLFPFGYGFAYRDLETFGCYTALIPFHFVVRYARKTFMWFRFAGASGATRYEQEIHKAYIRGRRERRDAPDPWRNI